MGDWIRRGVDFVRKGLMLLEFMARWVEEWMNSQMKLSQFRTLYIRQCFLRGIASGKYEYCC